MRNSYPYIIRPKDNLSPVLCPKCNIEHPISNYYKHSIRQDGFIRYRPICKNCRKNPQKKNKSRPVHSEILKNQSQICTFCKQEKNLFEFYSNGCFEDGIKKYRTRCKTCVKEINIAKYQLSKKTKAQIRSSSYKNYLSSLLLKTSYRKKEYEFNLDIFFLLNLYEMQNGKCAISGIDMTHIAGQGKVSTNISIDRIDPKKGYTKDNVHLVCLFINIMKYTYDLNYFLQICNLIVNYNNL